MSLMKNMYKNHFLILHKLFIIIFGLTVLTIAKDESATITVWVHGTYPAKRLLTTKYSPVRPMLHVPNGLSLAKNLPTNYYHAQFPLQCSLKQPKNYPIDHFYLFGWNSSNVRPKQRVAMGKKLYDEINILLKEYKKKYKHIKLRIAGFSHGGNVILNCLGSFPLLEKDIKTEVILLGTPIQDSTQWYANNPYVDKIYSFYSDADWIQRIDAQVFHKDAPKGCSFWSNRTFKKSDQVIQVSLKVNGKYIGHVKYRNIMHYLPDMMAKVEQALSLDQNNNHISIDLSVPKKVKVKRAKKRKKL